MPVWFEEIRIRLSSAEKEAPPRDVVPMNGPIAYCFDGRFGVGSAPSAGTARRTASATARSGLWITVPPGFTRRHRSRAVARARAGSPRPPRRYDGDVKDSLARVARDVVACERCPRLR